MLGSADMYGMAM